MSSSEISKDGINFEFIDELCKNNAVDPTIRDIFKVITDSLNLTKDNPATEEFMDKFRIKIVQSFIESLTVCDALKIADAVLTTATIQVCGLQGDEINPAMCKLVKIVTNIVEVSKHVICDSINKDCTSDQIRANMESVNLCQAIRFANKEIEAVIQAVNSINSPDAEKASKYLELLSAMMQNVETFVCIN
jgi:hypothetical protein